MMDTATAVLLTEYSLWADQVLFDAISRLPADEPYRQTNTLFRSMVGTLNHNLQVDTIWQAHLIGREHGFTDRRQVLHPDLYGLRRAQIETDRWFIDWAAGQTAKGLEEVVSFRFVSGRPAHMRKGDMLLHIINHKTYHRGWVSEMFFNAGTRPPETDISVYLCEVRTEKS